MRYVLAARTMHNDWNALILVQYRKSITLFKIQTEKLDSFLMYPIPWTMKLLSFSDYDKGSILATEDGRSTSVFSLYWQLSQGQMANFPAFIASNSFDLWLQLNDIIFGAL